MVKKFSLNGLEFDLAKIPSADLFFVGSWTDKGNCSTNQILGAFYCQGKMPISVRERYVLMIKEHTEDKNLSISIRNFDEALTHPDSNDLANVNDFTVEMLNLRREQMPQ